MRVDCLKGKEYKNERISDDKRISINEDISIGIHDIPVLYNGGNYIHYTQIGMTMYIVYEPEHEKIIYMYMIEQGIENNEVKIENIYTTTIVDKRNTLARFFRYDEEFERETLTTRLQEIIRAIPVIPEKEYLQRKITEYLEKEEIKVREVLESMPLEEKIYEIGKKGEAREIVCYGKTYRTIKDFADEYGIPYGTVTRKLYQNKTPEEIVAEDNKCTAKGYGNADPVICKGIKYRSKAEFARMNGMSSTTVISKLKEGKTPEQILEEKTTETRGGRMIPIEVTYKGVTYPSISELSRCVGIDLKQVSKLLKENNNADEVIENYLKSKNKHHGKSRVDEENKFQRDIKYEYEGEKFTIKELAELADIPRVVMWDRLRRSKWTVQKAVETPYIKREENINE